MRHQFGHPNGDEIDLLEKVQRRATKIVAEVRNQGAEIQPHWKREGQEETVLP